MHAYNIWHPRCRRPRGRRRPRRRRLIRAASQPASSQPSPAPGWEGGGKGGRWRRRRPTNGRGVQACSYHIPQHTESCLAHPFPLIVAAAGGRSGSRHRRQKASPQTSRPLASSLQATSCPWRPCAQSRHCTSMLQHPKRRSQLPRMPRTVSTRTTGSGPSLAQPTGKRSAMHPRRTLKIRARVRVEALQPWCVASPPRLLFLTASAPVSV